MHLSLSIHGIALIFCWSVSSVFPKDCRGQWWLQLWRDSLIDWLFWFCFSLFFPFSALRIFLWSFKQSAFQICFWCREYWEIRFKGSLSSLQKKRQENFSQFHLGTAIQEKLPGEMKHLMFSICAVFGWKEESPIQPHLPVHLGLFDFQKEIIVGINIYLTEST